MTLQQLMQIGLDRAMADIAEGPDEIVPHFIGSDGIDIDLSDGAGPACSAPLAYPAPRIGAYVVTCRTWRLRISLTTAGRRDDPRSLKVTCWRRLQ